MKQIIPKLETFLTETYKVPAPKEGSIISVYHPRRGAVEMKVIDVNKNIVTCEFEGEEFTVRLGKIGNEYRWEAEEL